MIINLYKYLHTHYVVRWTLLAALTVLLAALVSRLTYEEDISDFLPLGSNDREALAIYQDISGASRIIVIFDNPGDADMTTEAIEAFCNEVDLIDTMGIKNNVISKFDIEALANITDFVYNNIPYFLNDADYHRMDSLMRVPGYAGEQLDRDREMLMFPSGGMLSMDIAKDPLNLFTPVLGRLSKAQKQSHFETYGGYIFSPDMKKAIVMVNSPYGNSETANNAKIISLLETGIQKVQEEFPKVGIHLTGGPRIAVDNASQIKHDSMLAITIAIVLIALLLVYAFRSLRNIVLIVVSIAWGALFALGCVAVVHDRISIIILGLSSVIIGIAVNYPLHLIDHSNHEPDIRKSLKEIATPLVVGNITTIGAFLALVPLKSIALRDLGLYASLLLLGTIGFVLVFLPQMLKPPTLPCAEGTSAKGHGQVFRAITESKIENKRWLVAAVLVVTVILSWFSLKTEFDSDMQNINYLTEEQRADMKYFQSLLMPDSNGDVEQLFVVSSANSMDQALNGCRKNDRTVDSLMACGTVTGRENTADFITSKKEQQRRLHRWQEFVQAHSEYIKRELGREASLKGFNAGAFDDFYQIMERHYEPKGFEYFSALTNTVFAGNFSIDELNRRYYVVDRVFVKADRLKDTKGLFENCFDVRSMNSAIADSLSEDFNYIGIACSLIVFVFLWMSFGRIELAIISFLPMAVSWIWILGLMAIFGIKFNIVNIILATFIFGQGDDYTIFMTEGCTHEYAYRKPMLASYKNSIILSALIMFIGIGSLIIAKHPALLSLAEVTIIGMFSVVLMAYLIPPYLFNWITKSEGQYRKRPLTLGALARTWFCGCWWLIQLCIGYTIGFVLFALCGRNEKTKAVLHKIVTWSHRVDLRLFPGLKNEIRDPWHEAFDKPCIIICNHQSMLDPVYLMALSHKIIIVANKRSSWNPVIKRMFKWLDFYTVVEEQFEDDIPMFEKYVQEGYSIAVYAEGERNPESTILRFHKGAFLLASRLNLDILPIYLHGLNNAMPRGSFAVNRTKVTMTIGQRISADSPLWGNDYQETTRRIHRHFLAEYNKIKGELETPSYFLPLVKERYLYKGRTVYSEACKALSKENIERIGRIVQDTIVVENSHGGGALALLAALVYPDKTVYAIEQDPDRQLLALNSSQGIVSNLRIVSDRETVEFNNDSIIFI